MRVIYTCSVLLADQEAAGTSCNTDFQPNHMRMNLGRRVFVVILSAVGLATPAHAGDELLTCTVLVVDEFSPDPNFVRQFKQTIHSTLDSGMTSHRALYSGFLDGSRFTVELQSKSSKLTDAGGNI